MREAVEGVVAEVHAEGEPQPARERARIDGGDAEALVDRRVQRDVEHVVEDRREDLLHQAGREGAHRLEEVEQVAAAARARDRRLEEDCADEERDHAVDVRRHVLDVVVRVLLPVDDVEEEAERLEEVLVEAHFCEREALVGGGDGDGNGDGGGITTATGKLAAASPTSPPTSTFARWNSRRRKVVAVKSHTVIAEPLAAMHIGLIGGIGPAATAFYYQRIVQLFALAAVPLDLTIAHTDLASLMANMKDKTPPRGR